MTASAIRGDREKCLEAGMNNYLAKPVRADTLKQMLESYLHQPARPIPNLQEEANNLVNTVITQRSPADSSASASESEKEKGKEKAKENSLPPPSAPQNPQGSPVRPKNLRHQKTEIHLAPEERAKPPPKMDPTVQAAMSNMRKQLPKLNKPGDDKSHP
jgi:hypothetical protein